MYIKLQIIRKFKKGGKMVYSTKQRKIIIDFFNQNLDKSFSAEELSNALCDKDVSESAVYRNLNELEKEGRVRRLTKPNSKKSFYQFVDCDECKGHLHMACTKCGQTIHLCDKQSEKLIEDVLKNSNFAIDKNSTVLYGICKNCKSRGSL